MTKKIREALAFIGIFAWIPLGIGAFYVSSLTLDIKLFVTACVSFTGMIILWVWSD